MKSTKILNFLITFLFFCGINCGQDSNKINVDDNWFLAGSAPENYKIGKDDNLLFNERPVFFLKSAGKTDERFGTIMNYIPRGESLVEFLGKRVKMTGMIKSEDIAIWAGMWMRVDGPDPGKSLQFDNMSNRPIKGTNDWTKYEIVLDVPVNSTGIGYGVLIYGSGTAWLKSFTFEVVSDDFPVTNLSEIKYNVKDWFKSGSRGDLYEIGKDESIKYNDFSAWYLKSAADVKEGFGTLMRILEPGEYSGKRVKLTGKIKSENINNWAGMWMRVDGPDPNKSLQFDNMKNRPVKGSTDWTTYEIVLDVPDNSTGIAYGVLISGNGQVWLGEFTFEAVGSDIPSTNMMKEE